MAFTQEWVKNLTNPEARGPAVFTGPEGTSQTYKKGALVLYDLSDNGYIEVPRSSGVPDAAEVAGIALEDATGTDGTLQRFAFINVTDVWSAPLASDQDTTVAPDIDNRHQLAGIIKLSSTGGDGTEYVVDEDVTTHVQILGVDPRDIKKRGGDLDESAVTMSAGDRVLFRYLSIVALADGQQA